MVRVRNDAANLTSATVTVAGDGGGLLAERRIELPPTGAERDYFFDVAVLGETVSAQLAAEGDDQPADDRAWLVREASWPVIEAKQPVGALERLLNLYRQMRRSTAGSRTVYLVRNAAELPAGTTGAVVHTGGTAAVRAVTVAPHPVTDAVRNWSGLELPLATAAVIPAGWTPLVSADGGRVLVAVKESGDLRQAWIGIDADRWSVTHEYVAFWTATLDWLGTGGRAGESFASHALEERDADWSPVVDDAAVPPAGHEPALWPGVFTRQDGTRRAYHASPPDPAAAARP